MFPLMPAEEQPERFILIQSDIGVHILGGWAGDEWRMSTPIKTIEMSEHGFYIARTKSGSRYTLHLTRYGMNTLMMTIFNRFQDNAFSVDRMFDAIDESDACTTLLRFTTDNG